MSEQIDIAVDLGVVARPLPEILSLRRLVEVAPAPPPQIIEGVLHQGCKMVLGGTSKSNKSWCLLDLAMSVASGEKWWGRRCAKAPVLYMDFELQTWAIAQRLNALAAARPECKGMGDTLHVWNERVLPWAIVRYPGGVFIQMEEWTRYPRGLRGFREGGVEAEED